MSAQPFEYTTTRLLIADKSENAAHELDSTLRDAGIATKLSISDDLAHISQLVADGETDIAILTDRLDGLDKVLPRIHANAPHVPLVLLVDDEHEDAWSITQALSLGASDLVPAKSPEQLALVVQRELEHVCQRAHTSQLRSALKEAEQRCRLLLQGNRAAIAYVHEGMHIHANEHYLKLFGYAELDDLCTASLVDLLVSDCAEELKAHLKALRSDEGERVLEFTSNEACGEQFSGSMTLTKSQYEGEPCLQITVRKNDTVEETEAAPAEKSEIPPQELALPNFVHAAETLFNNHTGECWILCAGLDNINETQAAYGLLGTEIITRRVFAELSEYATDFPLARLDAHQFAFAVRTEQRDEIHNFAETLRQQVSDIMLEVHDKTVRPTIAIAGHYLNKDELGPDACLDLTFGKLVGMVAEDAANTVSIKVPEDDEDDETSGARSVLNQINHAIENKMFVLLYQPIISLRGDDDEHYEVFLRMVDDEGDQIEPGQFLQAAIDNNVAGKIDRWVILQSIKMLSTHRAKGNSTRLTINLSANSVTDAEFPQWLAVAIKAARLPSDAVTFQITEKDATTHLRQSREFVEKLRSMHCRASLSRFGIIEDPFETLRHIPVEMVKLDGSCINSMESDSERKNRLMEWIKELQGMGKLTIVPMVENANMLSTLWQAGANYIQGHYLQEPSTEMDYDFSTEE